MQNIQNNIQLEQTADYFQMSSATLKRKLKSIRPIFRRNSIKAVCIPPSFYIVCMVLKLNRFLSIYKLTMPLIFDVHLNVGVV